MVYFTRRQLRKMGLTNALVARLGKPDKIDHWQRQGREGDQMLWLADRVEAFITSLPSADKIHNRSANFRHRQQASSTYAIARGWALAERLVITHRYSNAEIWAMIDADFASTDTPRPAQKSPEGRALFHAKRRHECTNYDALCGELTILGKAIMSPETYDQIYLHLKTEANCLFERKHQ